ncbi:MAG: hypothetical protein IV098_11845 [Thiobacillus sp.]|nr:hypothetical protein [Thiobacillus sp.]
MAPWSVLISNIGSSTLSITSYEIDQVTSDNSIAGYSGLDSGLRQGDSLEPVSLPLSLESGKSVRFTLGIGLNPGVRAYEAILGSLDGARSTASIGNVEHLLASKSIDIYDNPVLPLTSDGQLSGWSVKDTSKEQIFLFKVRTARGVESGDLAFWYERERY